MDTSQIFKKAVNLTWRYRTLWLFGFLLAMTVSSSLWLGFTWRDNKVAAENQLIITDTITIRFLGQGLTIDIREPGFPEVTIEDLPPGWYRDLSREATLNDVWALLISIGVIVLICMILRILFRYTSQAALIRMVDENERDGKMASLRRGLRLGWSGTAGKLFLIDLVIGLLVFLVFSLLFALAISPFFLFGLKGVGDHVGLVGGVILLGLALLTGFTLLAIATAIVLSITRPVMYQACGVDGLSVWASIRQGFKLLFTRFSRVIVTWLVWIATRLVWTVASIPALIVLSPLILLMMLVGIVVGGIPALLGAGIASLFVDPVFAWIIGAVCGLPLFTLVTLGWPCCA